MGYRKHGSTAIAGLVLASLVAPMAHAESGPWIRYKQGYPSPVQTRVYHRGSGGGSSSVVPAIAGFIGGLVVGSQLHAAPVRERVVYTEPVRERVIIARPVCPEPVYYEDTSYYDPYNDDWYGSLDQCYEAERYSEGPRFVVEISARTGQCLNTYNWTGGGWRAGGSDARWNGCTRQTSSHYRYGGGNGRGYDRGGNGRGGYDRGGNGGWDRRTYNNRYGDNNRDSNRHDNRGGRGHGRWSDQQGRDDD